MKEADQFKWLLMLLALLLGFSIILIASLARGETLQCERCALGWDANQEADMKEYRVYVYPFGGAVSAPIVVPHVVGPATVQTEPLTLFLGTTYEAYVTAVDQSGNESGESNRVQFQKVDLTPPQPPQQFHLAEDGTVTVTP